MAKKKATPGGQEEPGASGGTPKKRAPKAKSASPRPKASGPRAKGKAVDWQSLEAAMWRMLGHPAPPDQGADSPRSLASALLHRAFTADDPREASTLARQALEVWPECADAYVLLAEAARGPKESLDFYVKGVEVAARDLGESAFREAVGMFWGLLPTRPYMRARLGLAQVLWVLGRREEAVDHYNELIRLNPNDNQGVRYRLAASLIELGRGEELAGLIRQFDEDGSATWDFSAALLQFRGEGDSPAARALLAAAVKKNKFVSEYLTGRTMLPSRMPDSVGVGDRTEAIDYVAGFLNGWRSTPGAIEWLRRCSQPSKSRTRPPRVRRPKGPTPASKKRLERLAITTDVWQADARLLPIWVNVPEEPRRPWVVVVASMTEGLILGQEVCEVEPTADYLWDTLARIMAAPADDEPRRPGLIEVGPAPRWSALERPLLDVDVTMETPESLPIIDDVIRQLVEHVTGRPPMPGLLDMPGVRPEQVASFYEAASSFYRLSPWQRVGGSETIKVACERFESGPWYAVVIGQMGMTLGVALYDDLNSLLRIRDGESTDEQNARETVALSVTYGNETEVAVADLEASERLGWKVAAPDAHPAAVRKERGLMMRPPLSWEIQLLDATLRILPDFIAEHDRDDLETYRKEVETGSGPLPIQLSWVDLDEESI